jgi:hypothetical protein
MTADSNELSQPDQPSLKYTPHNNYRITYVYIGSSNKYIFRVGVGDILILLTV